MPWPPFMAAILPDSTILRVIILSLLAIARTTAILMSQVLLATLFVILMAALIYAVICADPSPPEPFDQLSRTKMLVFICILCLFQYTPPPYQMFELLPMLDHPLQLLHVHCFLSTQESDLLQLG